jgi:chitobiase/beta-hexosaminidase-like protein
MPDLLQSLQLDIAARLQPDERFLYVPVLVWRPRDAAAAVMIRNTLNNALLGIVKQNGKGGLACMVMMPDAEVPDANVPGPQFEVIATVRVYETPIFNEGANGTHITAEQCALDALGLLHLWNPGGNVIVADKKAIREGSAPEGSIAHDVVVRQAVGVTPRGFVQRPRITLAGSMMSIACGTAGAAIYWSCNGTLPTPTTGALYAGAADISLLSAGTLIRAVAYKAGLNASDVAQLTL